MGSSTDKRTDNTAKRDMYNLKPVFQLPTRIELPTNMYALGVRGSTAACGAGSEPFLVSGTQDDDVSVGTTMSQAKAHAVNNGNSNTTYFPVSSKSGLKTGPSKGKADTRVPFQNIQDESATVPGPTERFELLSEKRVLAIETRQLKLIQKLNCLKELITQISQERDSVHLLHENIDVVVNVDPDKGGCPYSLLFLHKLLCETYGRACVQVHVHAHSSINSALPDHIHHFNQVLLEDSCDGGDEDNKGYDVPRTGTVTITLIWKKCTGLEFILNPLQNGVLTGESNFARYLSRLLPISTFPLNYDSLDTETLVQVDSYLDIDGTSFDAVEQHLKLLSASSFLIGECTIADFITYSNVANRVVVDDGSLSAYPNILNWLKNCELFGQFRLLFVVDG